MHVASLQPRGHSLLNHSIIATRLRMQPLSLCPMLEVALSVAHPRRKKVDMPQHLRHGALAYCFVLSRGAVPRRRLHHHHSHHWSRIPSRRAGDLLVDILLAQGVLPMWKPAISRCEAGCRDREQARQAGAGCQSSYGQIIHTLQSSSHGGLATIGFILAIYTSFNLMTQIIRTLLFIFDDTRKSRDTPGRGRCSR